MASDNRKQVTRDKIMRSALRLFAIRGFDAVSVQSIGEDAGIAHGTIFWHFGSKETLYVEVMRWAGERFVEAMEPVLAKRDITFSELASAELAYFKAHPEVGRLALAIVFEAIGPHPELAPALKLFNTRTGDIWRRWVRQVMDRGDLSPDVEPEDLVHIIVSAISGILVTGSVSPRNDPARLLVELGKVIERGCLAPSSHELLTFPTRAKPHTA
jgi:AcrR family transcriptional regulator